ncbi:DUF7674 family protein [Niveibacterium umoris]|nr:hypothetical protein [Niveibacterium umoris]
MIEKSQAIEVLVEACPSFAPLWAAHLAEWGNDVLYIATGEFASHLLAIYREGDQLQLARVAVAIERLHTEGSPWVKELATIGVLEGVQNIWANSGEDPESFGALLLPASRRAWNALNNFWSGKSK